MGARYIKDTKDLRDAVLVMVLCVVATIVLFNMIPIRNKIDQTYKGVVWEFGNSDDFTRTEIQINGEYTHYLFHLFHDRDKFDGTIVISAAEFTRDYLMLPVSLSNKPYELSSILYLDGETGDYRMVSIAASPMLKEGVFLLGNGSDERQMAVSYPGTDREQAVLCAQKLLHKDFNIY